MRPALLRAVYWGAGILAVGLVASVWFRLIGTVIPSAPRTPQTAALEDPAVAAAPAPEPPTPAVLLLRQKLPQVKGARAEDLAAVASLYGARTRFLWITPQGFSPKGAAVVTELGKADDWGLNAGDYAIPQLPAGEISAETAADAEIALTLALLKYARHARGGRIANPTRISPVLDVAPPVRPPQEVLAGLAAAEAPDAYLRALHPRHEQFEKLRQLLLKLRGRPSAPGGEAPAATAALPAAAPRPQPVAPSAAADIDRILINMERWRWLPDDLGALHVWNNVPEFLTRVVKDGRIINSDRIVAGQPAWPTPIFSADMKTIVFHPSWGVPDGIKRKELWPLLRRSSGGGLFGLFTGAPTSQAVLDAHKLQAYYNGRPIDPNQVDWASANISAYEFRQPPGPTNVLGAVKFLFPNKHDVYMHDTPDRSLFARSFRGLSHGCMRVGDPRRLAAVLLAEDKGWSKEKVAAMFAGGSQEVALDKHIPVHNTYFTAMVDFEGSLRTFPDLYALDARVGSALLGRKVRFATPSFEGEVAAVEKEERQRQVRQSPGAAPSSLADAIADIFSP